MEKKEKNHSFGLLVLRICFTSILHPAIKRLPIQVPNSNLMNLHKKIKSCKNISREEKLDMEKTIFPSDLVESMLICHQFFFFDYFLRHFIIYFTLSSSVDVTLCSEILSSIEVLFRWRQDRKTDFLLILLSLLLIIWYREKELRRAFVIITMIAFIFHRDFLIFNSLRFH